MSDRVAAMMIVRLLQEIRDEIGAMRAELQQLKLPSYADADDRQSRRDPPAPLARFPRRSTSSS